MKSKKMNPRIKQIMLRLCQEKTYVTIAKIAKDLMVSTKTVLRELPEVEEQLKEYGFGLDKKTGVGIGIQGGADAKQRIMQFLASSLEADVFSQKERKNVIISRLLQNQAPVKLYEFTSILKVTEGTISNDLDKLEPWFSEHQITLVRRPGLGVYIEATEQNIRKAIVHYIYENTNEEELLSLLYDNLADTTINGDSVAIKSSKYLLNLVDTKIICNLEKAVRSVEQEMDYQLADSAYVGLIVHLALAIQRIKKNEKIEMDQGFLADLQEKQEYFVAEKIANNIADIFVIAVPKDEIGYITMHLLGARNQYNKNGKNMKIIDNFHLVKLAKEMIKIAQVETGKNLSRHKNLLIGLVNHLGPSISRLKMNMDIRNPLLSDMQAHYPALLAISRKCAAVLEAELHMPMPEAEIAYIAMHLGAAIEDSKQLAKTEYRVAIACPTGMGTSRLLASRIKKEYDDLKVMDLISAIHIDEAYLKKLQVELLISTVSIKNCSLPVVVVNSLLLESDKAKINQQIVLLGKTKLIQTQSAEIDDDFKKKLKSLNEYSQMILELLQAPFVITDADSMTVEQLIKKISMSLKADINEAQVLTEELLNREAYGGTSLAGLQMTLLHCRSSVIDQLQFGVAQLPKGIVILDEYGNEETIKTAIVMLAPRGTSKLGIETIGYLSEVLLERWGFIEILHKGDQKMICLELSHIFKEFYQEKNKILLEG